MITEHMIKRFWEKVEKTNGCWEWRGSFMSSGYGVLSVGHSGRISAHRLSYEIANGDFDKSLYVCHSCDNKRCVNPDHLWLGTQSDNMKDCSRKGGLKNAYKWTRENNPNTGKPMSEKNKNEMSKRKMKPFEVKDPNGFIVSGVNLRQYCLTHNLNQGAMWSVINGKVKSHKGYTISSSG